MAATCMAARLISELDACLSPIAKEARNFQAFPFRLGFLDHGVQKL